MLVPRMASLGEHLNPSLAAPHRDPWPRGVSGQGIRSSPDLRIPPHQDPGAARRGRTAPGSGRVRAGLASLMCHRWFEGFADRPVVRRPDRVWRAQPSWSRTV